MSLPDEVPLSSRPPILPSGRSLRILYVSQFSALRDVARTSFRRLGHSLESVEDGIRGLEKIASDHAFDLVMVEHELPDMNGVKLVTLLRAQSYAGKILVLCSDLSDELELEYGRLAVDRIILKPVLPSDLRKCLSELFPGSGRVG